jgi:hypothetical protein
MAKACGLARVLMNQRIRDGHKSKPPSISSEDSVAIVRTVFRFHSALERAIRTQPATYSREICGYSKVER